MSKCSTDSLLGGFVCLLKSRRFQLLFLAALAFYFENFGFTLDPVGLAETIKYLTGGAAVVGTVDKFRKK